MNTPSAVKVTDTIDATRTAVAHPENVPAIVAQWLTDDGADGAASRNVRALSQALTRGDWSAVHAIADHMSLSVEAV